MLYIDNILIVGHDTSKIDIIKKELSKPFAMKDLGLVKQILRIKISRDRQKRRHWLSQEKYIKKILKRFEMIMTKTVSSHLASHFRLN